MISVVLYGRNDSYGYNLHKRAVLSLNCIAELLDDPDDEIIYVDYNTPDDLPTFTEAIGDMLSPKARRLVRTLRIRPAQHARFASQTHLRCLESPARNAAVRRSNPRNRWILSTNTDMVFVPRDGRSLSAIATSLPDGFYHTARFEVPEILWETLDRSDPTACIDAMRHWGKRFQLNEVVYGYPLTIFDGPGDFQLLLREDVFRIDGFDERMLLGWHVDTNTAIRLANLRRAPVDSVLDHLFAYHCDHTRESTPAHAHGAVQNSWDRFINDVDYYAIPEQSTTWGFADEGVEELRLDGPAPIISVLESVLQPMGDGLPIMSIVYPVDIRYDPEHAVPHIANTIGAYPRTWNVGFSGCRERTFSYFVGLWRELGFRGKILLPLQDPVAKGIEKNDSSIEVVDENDFQKRSDFFCFEIGRASDDVRPPVGYRKTAEEGFDSVSVDDFHRILQVHRTFSQAVTYARENGLASRRFVLVNMLNNVMQRTASWRIGTAATPTGSHLTHGFPLSDPFAPKRADPISWLQSRLGGPTRLSTSVARGIAQAVAGDMKSLPVLGPLAADVVHALSMSDAPSVFSTTRKRTNLVAQEIEERRFSHRMRRDSCLSIVDVADPERSLSRIAAFEDFDHPGWGQQAVRAHGPLAVENPFFRQRPIWQSAHVLYALGRQSTLSGRTLFLKNGAEPPLMRELLMMSLSDWAGECTIADTSQGFPGDGRFDAVVLSEGALLFAGLEHIPAILVAVDQALRVGGTCIATIDLVISERATDALDISRLTSGIFDVDLARETAWRMPAPIDLSVSAPTLDTLATTDSENSSTLVHLDDNARARISCVLAFVKEGQTEPADWERYYKNFREQFAPARA